MFRFTTRQIEMFLAVCEHGSFRKAAEQFDVSEAAVSNHIRTLERQLGCSLFVRRRGTAASLSQDGIAFREGAQVFIDKGIDLASQFGPAREIGTSYHCFTGPHLLDDIIRPALPQFLQDNSDIGLTLAQPKSIAWLRRAILAETVDCAFLIVRESAHLPNSEHIGTVNMGIFATPALIERASREGLSAIDYLVSPDGGADATGQLASLARAGIKEIRIARRYPFHDVGVHLAQEGVGAIVTLESIVRKHDTASVLQPLKLTARWEKRLYINPAIPDPHARLLRGFFLSLDGHDSPGDGQAA
jgi:DNA-binding transcriptional LysR family regulator